ncbi:kynureninase [Streptomyces lavendulae subsp. lavendulae]|uniref:kynureninase n=1 Tax=Streptomyces lavendulae TaxID=1914 RepID=UPI0024A51D78|nr:kynureninase [Streptomyces lavendulae]GLV87043.1 kynureninase [Streptomyces lavendulae subsp. lavendulae]
MSDTTDTDLAERAARLDALDGLAKLRERFTLPDGVVYLDGNSLGALPAAVPDALTDVVRRQWGELLIRSWDESGWWTAPERIGDLIAPLVGAAPGQVTVGDSTSVNLFKALVGAARMAAPGRTKLLVDATTFPTDGYIAASAARLTGLDLVPVDPADAPGAFDGDTAVVLLNHVDYRSGRLHDLPGLTAAAHAAGALIVWDLCHSAGALPVGLDAHDVDLAVGCTYKYLNGGPGSPAYVYVAARHQGAFDSPLPGWNSHREPFAMTPGYEPAEGAARARVGTPDILSMLALESALGVWEGVAVEDVRAKSLALTDFFLECVARYVPAGKVEVVTPAGHAERGSQVSLRTEGAREVMAELISRGVVGDFRAPDVLRFGFTPLYVGFADAERAARTLGHVFG